MDSSGSGTRTHLEMPDLARLPGSYILWSFHWCSVRFGGREALWRQEVWNVHFQLSRDTHRDTEHQRKYIKRIRAWQLSGFYRGQSLVLVRDLTKSTIPCLWAPFCSLAGGTLLGLQHRTGMEAWWLLFSAQTTRQITSLDGNGAKICSVLPWTEEETNQATFVFTSEMLSLEYKTC